MGFLDFLKRKELMEIEKLKNERDNFRPSLELLQGMTGTSFSIPFYPLPLDSLYDVALYCDVLRLVIRNLTNEIFRNGFEFQPAFLSKCSNPFCGAEFEFETPECKECHSKTFKPDYSRINELKKKFMKVNENKQSLLEVLRAVNYDLEVVDDGYILVLKDYFFNSNGEIIAAEIKEILRGSPLSMRIIADKTGRPGRNENSEKVFVCPIHRSELITESNAVNQEFKCLKPECNLKLQQAFYFSVNVNGDNDDKIYYLEDEVIHKTKYYPSLTYGFSNIFAIWQKIAILLQQDKYLKEFYTKQRPPKGLLLINTANASTIEKAWDKLLTFTKHNPHGIYPLAVESNSQRGQVAQFISFMNDLNQMQFTESRNEIRTIIGSLYGVMPLFQGDVSTSGGLNNEGLQVTVTNRAVESGQALFNEFFLPELLRQFGVTDFKLVLRPSEEQDKASELQRNAMKISNARMMLEMGFDVKLKEGKEFDFVFSGQAKPSFESPLSEPALLTAQQQRFSGEPKSVKRAKQNDSNESEIKKSQPTKPKKTLNQQKQLASEFEKELEKELKDMVSKLDFKRKPPQPTLKKIIADMTAKLASKLKGKSETQIKKIYKEAITSIEKELNMNIGFGRIDENAVKLIQSQKVFTDAYKNLNESLSAKLNELIANAYKNPDFSLQKLVQAMKKEVTSNDYVLERIARNEAHNVSTIARLNSYTKVDANNEFKYKWINPLDHRTTKHCKKIVERTKNGVSMPELIAIIREEADENVYQASRPFTPHIQCRSTFIKI